MLPLSLPEALHLHRVIAPYLPEQTPDTLTLDYMRDVVDAMRLRAPEAYIRCIEIMMGKPFEEVLEMPSYDLLDIFTGGLQVNRILELKQFCEELGYVKPER